MSITEQQPAPSTGKKKGGKAKWIIGGVGALVVIGGIAAAAGGGSSTANTAAPATQATPSVVTETVQAPAAAPVTVTVQAPPVTVTVPADSTSAGQNAAVGGQADVAAAGPADEVSKSGVYVVGEDIKAGKWKTDGKINEGSFAGYFAILADPTGSTSDIDNIVTNDNPEGQAFATLKDGQGLENNNLHWVWIGE